MITKKLLLLLFLGIVSSYLTACGSGSSKNSDSPEQPIKQVENSDIPYEIPKEPPIKPENGALEIPEPSTLAFVSLGAIALIAKRPRYHIH